MAMDGNFRLEKGDWVKGKTRNGELIRGYIEAVDPLHDVVKVYVVESDNEKIIGKTIGMLNKSVEKLPVSTQIDEEQIIQLIDLALLTKDEQWFNDLSTKLASLKASPSIKNEKNNDHPISKNRIGNSDTRG